MQLPEQLQFAIEQIVQNTPHSALKKARESLTQAYREGRSSPFSDEAKRLAYLGARMPATYAAIYKVLTTLPFAPSHLLDLGAGPGTASWAAAEALPSLKKITLVEKSPEAIALGKTLAKDHPLLKQSDWIQQSLPAPLPQADGAILSYVLNELPEPFAIIHQIWEKVPLLILIEPGTPKGFHLIRDIREQLLKMGGYIISPCTHSLTCPIQGSDWCHFSARVERTRLHRLLKEGSLGYEDEKFSYLIMAKSPGPSHSSRIIRRPEKGSGFVKLTLCTGKIETQTVTRSDKEAYRKARDAEWGDVWG